MEIRIKTFSQLDTTELYALLQLRSEVFVVEQDCVYQDVDGKDQKALHILGFENGKLAAYTRAFKGGDYFDTAAIGRVVVKEEFRGKDYGKQIMLASIEGVETHFNTSEIKVSAQTYLKRFYNDLNFIEEGEGYLEDGIPHILMRRT